MKNQKPHLKNGAFSFIPIKGIGAQLVTIVLSLKRTILRNA
jgi:hypothetical protein